MLRKATAYSCLGASFILLGCGGAAVDQDGRTFALEQDISGTALSRRALPVDPGIPLLPKVARESTRAVAEGATYDTYLKLWYVLNPVPLAQSDAVPGLVNYHSVSFYKDSALKQDAGYYQYQNVQFEGRQESKLDEEYTAGTRGGQKKTRDEVRQTNGNMVGEQTSSDSTTQEEHTGRYTFDSASRRTEMNFTSKVKGQTIISTAVVMPDNVLQHKSQFDGVFTVDGKVRIEWKERPGSTTIDITGNNPLLPAKGTITQNRGSMKFADGTVKTFTYDEKGIVFN
jgi:hypothetical protein